MVWTLGCDAHAIVFDNGTSTTKIGYAPVNEGGDPVLVKSIPTLYGVPKEMAAMEGVADETAKVGKEAMVSYCKVAINCVTN